jgi:hypothetical protein
MAVTHDPCEGSLWQRSRIELSRLQGELQSSVDTFAPVRFAVACEDLKNLV